MPSSRLEVATRHGSSPAFSRSSTSRRSSRASEPWWARAIGSSASSFSLQREPLGAAPVVDEDQGRAVLAHQLQQLGVDRRPDRLAGGLVPGALERVELDARVTRLDHRLDRHVDLQVERLADAGVDDRARALRADEEAADLLERVLGRRQADPLDVAPGRLGEPLEREREVRAALGLRDRVDLVDDHLLDAVEDLRRLAGEHQVQRLRRGDQDVRRVADHRLPLLLRRVAGPDRRPSRRRRSRAAARAGSSPRRRRAPSGERRRPAACGRRSARATSRSSAHRNAASVLPEPVGAEISVCSPVAIAGHACAWAGVGAAKARSNHSRDLRREG